MDPLISFAPYFLQLYPSSTESFSCPVPTKTKTFSVFLSDIFLFKKKSSDTQDLKLKSKHRDEESHSF